MIHPIVVGHGRRLFEAADALSTAFDIADVHNLPAGVLDVTYRPTTS